MVVTPTQPVLRTTWSQRRDGKLLSIRICSGKPAKRRCVTNEYSVTQPWMCNWGNVPMTFQSYSTDLALFEFGYEHDVRTPSRFHARLIHGVIYPITHRNRPSRLIAYTIETYLISGTA